MISFYQTRKGCLTCQIIEKFYNCWKGAEFPTLYGKISIINFHRLRLLRTESVSISKRHLTFNSLELYIFHCLQFKFHQIIFVTYQKRKRDTHIKYILKLEALWRNRKFVAVQPSILLMTYKRKRKIH